MSASGSAPLAIRGARLIDPASGLDTRGDLLIQDGRIADLGPGVLAAGVPEGAVCVEAGGLILAPGLVDMRVFVGEPGGEHRETLASASHAAAAGGVTTIVCMPNTDPPIDGGALVDYLGRRAAETACVNVRVMAAITRGLKGRELTEMGLLADAGAVAFTDGDRAVADPRTMRMALTYARMFDKLVVQHAIDPDLARDGAMNEGEVSTRLGLTGIPTQAETIIVERDLRLLELAGGRYHVGELSCADAVAVVRAAKARGLAVTAGVATHHFALNENAVAEYRTFAKTMPPLRTEDDRRAVVAGIADGTIDVIVSSHAPHDQEAKRQPFAQAAWGVVGLETMLTIALELVHRGHADLHRVLGAMTCRPASLLGLDCGQLVRGAPGDLVLIDLEAPWRVDAEKLASKSKNTPYDGRPVQGRAVLTVVRGRIVHDTRP